MTSRPLALLSDAQELALLNARCIRSALQVAIWSNRSVPASADAKASDLRIAIADFGNGDPIDRLHDATVAGMAELVLMGQPFDPWQQARLLAPATRRKRSAPDTVHELLTLDDTEFRAEHDAAVAVLATFRAQADLLKRLTRDLPDEVRKPVLLACRKTIAALKRRDINAAAEALAKAGTFVQLGNSPYRSKAAR
jgi:hypothetical protein